MQLADLAVDDERSSLFGAGSAGVVAQDGRLVHRHDPSRGDAFETIMARAGQKPDQSRGGRRGRPGFERGLRHACAWLVFAEIKVGAELEQVRCTCLVGAFAAGRVVNPRLVRSQYFGGMIWGMSFTLHEQAVADKRSGRLVNANLAEYHVPVIADVPSLETILVEEVNPHVNALGIKGVGEIGIVGTAGAIANAVWHATGTRVREFPITLDRLL